MLKTEGKKRAKIGRNNISSFDNVVYRIPREQALGPLITTLIWHM